MNSHISSLPKIRHQDNKNRNVVDSSRRKVRLCIYSPPVCPIRRWRSSPAGRRPSPTQPIPSSRNHYEVIPCVKQHQPCCPLRSASNTAESITASHTFEFPFDATYTNLTYNLYILHRPNMYLKYNFLIHTFIHLSFQCSQNSQGFQLVCSHPRTHLTYPNTRIEFSPSCAKPCTAQF